MDDNNNESSAAEEDKTPSTSPLPPSFLMLRIAQTATSFKSCLPNSTLCSITLSIIRYGNAFEYTCSKIIV